MRCGSQGVRSRNTLFVIICACVLYTRLSGDSDWEWLRRRELTNCLQEYNEDLEDVVPHVKDCTDGYGGVLINFPSRPT